MSDSFLQEASVKFCRGSPYKRAGHKEFHAAIPHTRSVVLTGRGMPHKLQLTHP